MARYWLCTGSLWWCLAWVYLHHACRVGGTAAAIDRRRRIGFENRFRARFNIDTIRCFQLEIPAHDGHGLLGFNDAVAITPTGDCSLTAVQDGMNSCTARSQPRGCLGSESDLLHSLGVIEDHHVVVAGPEHADVVQAVIISVGFGEIPAVVCRPEDVRCHRAVGEADDDFRADLREHDQASSWSAHWRQHSTP